MKSYKILLVSFIVFCFVLNANAQDKVKYNKNPDPKKINKGKVYVLAGWNWARYTKSDIHFSGEGHEFTLHKVKANDRPAPFSANLYFNPKNISIPQTNLKIGYFFHNNWNLAFNLDHMKYVVETNQEVLLNGHIDVGSTFDGTYNDYTQTLYRSFLQYEHTDGLNFVNFEINRFDRILKTRFIDVAFTEGFGFGALVPRSDVVLLNNAEWDKYHLAGYGLGLKAAMNITFFNYFHIQSEAKGGFVHLPSVKTTPIKTDNAKQSFFYFQHNFLFGAVFPIVKKEKRIPESLHLTH